MKFKYLSIFALAAVMFSCGGGETTEETTENTETTEETTEVVEEVVEEVSAYPEGEEVYKKTCMACHQADGKGLPGAFPPLAESDYLLSDKGRAIEQILIGSEGEITVNGEVYNGIMPAQVLSDQEVVDVMNYILNSWGNEGGTVTLEEVTGAKHPQ